MKKFFCTTVLTLLIASAAIAGRQDYPEEYLGLPGDNLNLYAVMNLFQESETLEAFERSLNEENTRINNLDLNNDGYVDYLTVSDYVNGNVHTIVIRSVLDRNEFQDVAVFTVEQLRNGEVQIQLIGDEALYGRNYIVEPNYAETPNPGYKGRTVQRKNVTVVTTTYYEVAAWPVIRFIYSPRYVVWRSSWYWGYYPVYWRPWKPFFWHYYYGYHYHWYPHYYTYYRHWHQPRWIHYRDYYYGSVRVYSPNVSHRITAGTYKQTYSRPESRRDGEALYAKTVETRSRSVSSQQAEAGRRQSATTAATQSQSRTRSTETSAGSDRRSPATAGSRPVSSDTRRSATTQPSTRTQTSNEGRSSAPATRTQTSSSGRSNAPAAGSERRSPATTGNSSVSSDTRRSATTQPSTRTQTSSSGRSSTPAARTQSGSSGRSSAPAARTQSGSSGRSSAPAARTQSRSSGRSSGTVSSRSSNSRSSGASSKSSSSSGNSDNSSRSSRR